MRVGREEQVGSASSGPVRLIWTQECALPGLLTFAPQPEPQSPEDDEGHGTQPERYVVAACRHSHSEDDANHLRKSNEPEHNGTDKRRRLLHLNTLPSERGSYRYSTHSPRALASRAHSRQRPSRKLPSRLISRSPAVCWGQVSSAQYGGVCRVER